MHANTYIYTAYVCTYVSSTSTKMQIEHQIQKISGNICPVSLYRHTHTYLYI